MAQLNLAIMDFTKICRVCLLEKQVLISLFEATVAKMLMACASVIVMEGDGLPDKICNQCTLAVSRAFTFKQLCEKSDNTLRQYITSKNSNDANLKSEILLDGDALVDEHCYAYSEIFMKNNTTLADPLLIEQATVQTDVAVLEATMHTMTEHCLPSLWNIKRTEFTTNSSPDILNAFPDDTLSMITPNKVSKNDWTSDMNPDTQDIDSSLCDKSFIDLDNSTRIINEEKSKRLNNKYNCEICGNSYLTLKDLKDHSKVHVNTENVDEEKKHMCSVCGKRYKQNKILMLHMRSHTGERPLKCDICDKTFSLPSCLYKHRLIHTGQKLYKCTVCEKSFLLQSYLNAHMKKHTGEKPYVCTDCGKAYTRKISLEYHLHHHRGGRPFTCNICNMSFITNMQLKKHSTKHSGEKSYLCPQCGRGFRQKDTRDTHVRYHTGERPFACPMCPKRYIARNHLRAHILSHTGERRHHCTICNSYFFQKRHLTAHLRTHTGERPHSCQMCNRSFAHSGSLSAHMKSHKKII